MGVVVEGIKERLESELLRTMERIRHMERVEELPRPVGDDPMLVDEVSEAREMSFATRSFLVERAKRLANALKRLREGDYGLCQECGGAIAPARLRVIPEATTCVSCQERLERLSSRLATAGAGFA